LGGILRLGLDHQRVLETGLGDLPLARRAPHAVVGERLLPVRRGGELAVSGDVVVGAGDDADPPLVRVAGQALEQRDDLFAAGDVQSTAGSHEVHLRVHVPEDRPHTTRSSFGFGRYSLPTLAVGFTTSAVKSKRPWKSELPTPYTSTGTPWRSNSRIFSTVKPPETISFTWPKPPPSRA